MFMNSGALTIMNVEKIMYKLLQPWVIGLVLVLYIILFAFVDKPVAIYFDQLQLSKQYPWLHTLTNWGDKSRALICLFLVPMFFRYVWPIKRFEIKAWFVWCSVAFASAVSLILKLLLGRARPYLLFHEDMYGFYGYHPDKFYWSLPSGHVATIMAVMFSMMILFPRFRIVFGLFGLSVMTTRVILTYHYLSDVLMTAYLAWFFVCGVYFALKYIRKEEVDFIQYKAVHE